MSIDISPETEQAVRDELLDGHFRSVDDLILAGVLALRNRHGFATFDETAAYAPNGEDNAREFIEWAPKPPGYAAALG